MKLSNGIKSALPAAVLGFLALGLVPMPAHATVQTATFAVSTNIVATCTISTTPMSFGPYTGLALSSTASVTVVWTNTTGYNVGLDAGTATGATITNRSMTGPA